MKRSLYPRLAWQGIRKNGKIYFPYLAASIFVVMVYYLIGFLSNDPVVREMEGGEQMQLILMMGSSVMAVFSVIFLFYTNSFLMKRRRKELGLYHVLGMGRKNVAFVLAWESLITTAVSLTGGILCGVLFSKMGQLAMVFLLGGEADFSFSVNLEILLQTLKIYGSIFFLLLLYRIFQIFRTKPLELLKSESLGERPPKANWVSAVLGVLLLGGAYYLSVTVKEPLTIIWLFFVAVIMVIAATYLLFMAGSVALCKVLKKNKKYYYKTNHFVSLSSMMFRMKRNGAGLASICILSTMVLVMVSGTMSLYLGTEDSLRSRYPRDLVVNTPSLEETIVSRVDRTVREALDKYGVSEENVLHYRQLVMSGMVEGNRVILDYGQDSEFSYEEYEKVRQIIVVPVEDYNQIMGKDEKLERQEILVCNTKTDFREKYQDLTLEGLGTWKIKDQVDFVDNGVDAMQIIPTTYLFVADQSVMEEMYEDYPKAREQFGFWDYYGADLDCSDKTQNLIAGEIDAGLQGLGEQDPAFSGTSVECVGVERMDFYSMYAGLFFLGVLLGIVFLLGMVLIMYYKQVSEGYEDQERFAILQKVGMTGKEIRKSINSQILTVFFLPLIWAGIHTAFAFPMIWRLLELFSLHNIWLLIGVTGGCFLGFGLVYVLMYLLTSRSYYKIVSGGSSSSRRQKE